MTTVSVLDRWIDEYAEGLIGLPIAEAVNGVLDAGLHVEVTRPDVRRVRDRLEPAVGLTANRRGIVTGVVKVPADLARPDRIRAVVGGQGSDLLLVK